MSLAIRRQRGFTLLELMIVVGVIAVLAAIAVVSFTRLKRRAIRSEVASVLGAISLRQETYRAEYASYKTCSAAVPPLGIAGSEPRKKNFTKPTCWAELGLTTDPALYCSYTIFGGNNATSWDLTRPQTDNGTQTALPSADQAAFGNTNPTTTWYLAKAECDLDGDGAAAGSNSIFYRTHFSSGIAETNPDR